MKSLAHRPAGAITLTSVSQVRDARYRDELARGEVGARRSRRGRLGATLDGASAISEGPVIHIR